MEKCVYLIRHSGPFLNILNYRDYENVKWNDYNRNMILSVEGEENAKKLRAIDELKDVSMIYASDSFRAISTAKYVCENIMLDERINERAFGVDYLSELPNNFTKDSFFDKDLKVKDGESLNEVDERVEDFLKEKLLTTDKLYIVVHGLLLLSYLKKYCDFNYDGESFDIKFKGKSIVSKKLKNPDVIKVTFSNDDIIDIDCLCK